MIFFNKIIIFMFLVSINIGHLGCNPGQAESTPSINLTWMSNTNWLIETADAKILLDGWITRIPRPARPDLRKPETLSMPPVLPDTAGISRIYNALHGEKKIKYIISGHSHFDHSFDTAVWARLTGAKVLGPRSTCLQAAAQGIPESQCIAVHDGGIYNLGVSLSVRAVRWHHSGDPSNPLLFLLQTPMELVKMPVPDSLTGGLRPGILEDFPMGCCWAYLFTFNHSKQPLTWLWSNSGNPHTFHESKIIDNAFLKEYKISLINLAITAQEKSTAEYLAAALTAEKLDSVHLWIGYNNSYHVEQVIDILKPKAFIPQHWGGLWSSFYEGLKSPYSNERLISVLKKKDIDFLAQSQYMDKFRLDANGIVPVSNDEVKRKLGFID